MKRILTSVCHWLELTDYEYIRGTFGPWPFRFFFTVIEPNRRWSWRRKAFPWRIRCCVASLALDVIWRHCTKCNVKLTLRELVRRGNDDLIHFQSGSICHKTCPEAK